MNKSHLFMVGVLFMLSSTVHAAQVLMPVDIAEYNGVDLNRFYPMTVQSAPSLVVAAEYDLHGLGPIVSALLDLSTSAQVLSPFELNISSYTGDGSITAGDFPPTNTTFVFSGFVNSETVLQFDVTTIVQTSLGAGDQYLGFLFRDIDNATLQFNSAPMLTITAVPLPAAAWLFGSGLLGLIGMARKKAA